MRKVNRKLGTRFSQAHPIDRTMFEKNACLLRQ
jgi:hypothetical protein